MCDDKNKGGRPPKFTDVNELEYKVEDYFNSCDGRPLLDSDGNPVLNKFEEPILIGQKPYTVTGLALHLGFNSRQSLLNYQAKKEFLDTIMRAKSRIEEYAEMRLYDKDGCNGAKFNLTNNFGWEDRSKVDNSISGDLNIIKVKLPDDND